MKTLLRHLFFITLSLIMSSAIAEPININHATLEEITANIKGIGETKAQALIDYRETNGPFVNEEELLKVKGIGQKTLESIRDLLIKNDDNTQLAQ